MIELRWMTLVAVAISLLGTCFPVILADDQREYPVYARIHLFSMNRTPLFVARTLIELRDPSAIHHKVVAIDEAAFVAREE